MCPGKGGGRLEYEYGVQPKAYCSEIQGEKRRVKKPETDLQSTENPWMSRRDEKVMKKRRSVDGQMKGEERAKKLRRILQETLQRSALSLDWDAVESRAMFLHHWINPVTVFVIESYAAQLACLGDRSCPQRSPGYEGRKSVPSLTCGYNWGRSSFRSLACVFFFFYRSHSLPFCPLVPPEKLPISVNHFRKSPATDGVDRHEMSTTWRTDATTSR